jgi:hypothetical protein
VPTFDYPSDMLLVVRADHRNDRKTASRGSPSLAQRSAHFMEHTAVSLIGVAKFPLPPWLQLQLQPHCAADLRSTYNYNWFYTL